MAGQLVVVRHAETEWSAQGRLTGVTTDIPLTAHGELQASAVGETLRRRQWVSVLVSPMARTRRTAELLGAAEHQIAPELSPWDYGTDEGAVVKDLVAARPGWSLFEQGPTGGESPRRVRARVDGLVSRTREELGRGDVLVVGHSHVLQVLAARWLALPVRYGADFALDTAGVGVLGEELGRPALMRWNVPPPPVRHSSP